MTPAADRKEAISGIWEDPLTVAAATRICMIIESLKSAIEVVDRDFRSNHFIPAFCTLVEMLCSECGGELVEKGETVDGGDIYQCDGCSVQYVKKFERLREENDASSNTSGYYETVHPHITGPVVEGLYDEIPRHVMVGELDYRLRDVLKLDINICPYCNMKITGEIDIGDDKVHCDSCNQERKVREIQLFTSMNYIIYRFAIMYRNVYELEARRGRDIKYDLPPVPPEAVWIVSAAASGIIGQAAWEGVTRSISYIRNKIKEENNSLEEENSGIKLIKPNSDYIYKILDLVNLIGEQKFKYDFISISGAYLARAYLMSERGYSYEEGTEIVVEHEDHDLEDGIPILSTENPSTWEKQFYDEEEWLETIERIHDEDDLGNEVPNELEFDWITGFVSTLPERQNRIKQELDGLTRREIIIKIVTDFCDSFEEGLELILEMEANNEN